MKTLLIITLIALILTLLIVNKYRKMYKSLYLHQKNLVRVLRIRLKDIDATPEEMLEAMDRLKKYGEHTSDNLIQALKDIEKEKNES